MPRIHGLHNDTGKLWFYRYVQITFKTTVLENPSAVKTRFHFKLKQEQTKRFLDELVSCIGVIKNNRIDLQD